MKMEIVLMDGKKVCIDNVKSFKVEEDECHESNVARIPTAGKLFEVNPEEIDRKKFEELRGNRNQEKVRQLIQEAFAEVDKNPEKYAVAFYTLFPEKAQHVNQKEYAREYGILYANDSNAEMTDWVQWSLELAQRIVNGESWKAICNDDDTAEYFRMIVWKDGNTKVVGGSRLERACPAQFINGGYYALHHQDLIVPSIVVKKYKS